MVVVCVCCICRCSRTNESGAVVETNGKDQGDDHPADASNLSHDRSSKSGAVILCELDIHLLFTECSLVPLVFILFTPPLS